MWRRERKGNEMGPIILLIILILIILLLASCIKIVPQAQAYVVERLGAYQGTWSVGLKVKLPIIDKEGAGGGFCTAAGNHKG